MPVNFDEISQNKIHEKMRVEKSTLFENNYKISQILVQTILKRQSVNALSFQFKERHHIDF